MKKRTYSYDEYVKLVKEGVDDIGFRPYISEHEEDLGAGEEIPATPEVATPSTTEEVPASETPAPVVEEKPIDTGDKESLSIDEVKVKMAFLMSSIKNLNDLVLSSDKVALDKATKDKIVKIYNLIQGVV